MLRRIYTGYSFFLFAFFGVIFFFPLLIPIFFPKQFKLVGVFNRLWAHCLFFCMAMPVNVKCRKKLDPTRQYIFCPNHFSYLDIPIMGLNPMNAIFVGKSDMENIPFFGYMYRKLHITVDRTKLKSKFSTFIQSLAALDYGKSLVIYPEGGIYSTNPPSMAPFKDGAFRAAIEKQVAIVPVTIPFNWIVLPDQPFVIHWRKNRIIFHEPIDTTGLTIQDMNGLKERVYQVIDGELKKYEPNSSVLAPQKDYM